MGSMAEGEISPRLFFMDVKVRGRTLLRLLTRPSLAFVGIEGFSELTPNGHLSSDGQIPSTLTSKSQRTPAVGLCTVAIYTSPIWSNQLLSGET